MRICITCQQFSSTRFIRNSDQFAVLFLCCSIPVYLLRFFYFSSAFPVRSLCLIILPFILYPLNFVLLNKFSLLVVKIPTRIDVKYDVTISSCDTFLRFSFSFSVIYLLVDHGCSGAL